MDARLCGACGAPLGPQVDRCPSCGSPAPPEAGRRAALVVAAVVAVVALLVTTVAVVVLVAGGSGGDGPAEVFVAAPDASTTTSTVAPMTAAPTTAPPPSTAPPTVPPAAVTGDPYEVIEDWVVGSGLSYVGLCEQLDPTLDLGPDPWCAQIWEDRGTEMVVRVADFPGGDFGVWLLLRALPTGWAVVEVAEDLGTGSPF